MKSKFLPLAVVAVILATFLMVSTATVPAAAATSGWHKTTLTRWWQDEPIDDWQGKEIRETSRYVYYTETWYIHDVHLTIMSRYDKTKGIQQILSIKYQDSYWDLNFIGMKGIIYFDSVSMTWVYEISGSGVGSYGSNSRFGDAFVKGTIWIYTLEGWYFIDLYFDVTYFVA